MSYNLSFTGVSFRVPTPEIMERIERFDWLRDLRDVLPAPQVFPGPNLLRAGFPTPLKYPDVRIGDFFYPVGASRWSIFRGLMTADDVAAVTATARSTASWPANTSQQMQGTFKIQSEVGDGDAAGSVETQLFMLPPVPIMGGAAEPTLYMIDLVDERYFWQQWMNPADCSGSALESWSAYLNQLASSACLNITLTFSTPSGDYGQPEKDSPLCTQSFDNPAVLFDLVAANVGCVVVRNLDGTYKLQRFADALTAIAGSRPTSGNNILGGSAWTNPPNYWPLIPATIRVVMPRWTDDDGSVSMSIGTATDTATIGIGNPTFTVGTGLDWLLGCRALVVDSSNDGNYMEGFVTAYDGGSGVITIAVDTFCGSGRISLWNVSQVGFRTGNDTSGDVNREYYRDSYYQTIYIDIATSSLGEPYTLYPTFTYPGTKVIRTTARARFDQNSDLLPQWINQTACTNLATQLAKDYLDARLAWTDEAYAGIYPWEPEGVSDLLYCWRHGEAFTRILAPPFNAGPTDFQHGFGTLSMVDEHKIRVGATVGDAPIVYQQIATLQFTGDFTVAVDSVRNIATVGTAGASGSFTSGDETPKTITVVDGLITAID